MPWQYFQFSFGYFLEGGSVAFTNPPSRKSTFSTVWQCQIHSSKLIRPPLKNGSWKLQTVAFREGNRFSPSKAPNMKAKHQEIQQVDIWLIIQGSTIETKSVTTTHLDIKQLLVVSAHWKSNNRTFILRSVPCSVFSWFSISYAAWKVQVSFNTLPAGSNPRIRRLSFTSWLPTGFEGGSSRLI